MKESNADVSGYTCTVTGSDSTEVKSSSETPAEITLTNQYVPENKTKKNITKKPEVPPYQPPKSSVRQTVRHTDTKGSSKDTEVSSNAPKTGDPLNLSAYILAFAGAAIILTAILRYRKGKR